MKLRKHQQEMSDLCDRINNGEPIREIICDVTPGGGKTGLGIIAAKKLTRGFCDKVAVFVPRNTLKYQFESDMIDPFFESDRTIRAADNTPDPSRGLDGFSTTYQGLSSNPESMINDFEKHKYIKICDEFHHISDDGEWEKPLNVLRDLSKLNIYMTGTAFRQKDRISFLPYGDNGYLDRRETPYRKFLTYTRTDALEENAIVPIEFETIDGSGRYRKNDKIISFNTIEHKDLEAALKSDYAFQLIDHGLDKFMTFRKYNPDAKMIIVGRDIATTQLYCDHVNKRINSNSVSSDDKDSVDIINRFKAGEFPVLCGTGIPYEGLNVPDCSDMVALTHIRSISWLSQMTARAVRVTPWKTIARITAPADPEFLQFMSALINEQEQICGSSEEDERNKKGKGTPKHGIEIIQGSAHIPPSAKEKIVREELNLRINRYISEQSTKIINGKKTFVHTESMTRRKILWYRIYIKIGRKCQLKEMTMPEMDLALNLIIDLTSK
ncbi:DEAD/DEAH box helicase family protein [Oceanispirochaeta sp.]|uniref:DEAD/DEAH box helicase n=1 Tax=Oceanispirochaeta sp. TaxID=2035350 RepID=UPI002605DBD7|nr:DEAD/DEAH box helicase family protein [Oceanispirochaeta sp.]MDA3957966.1 DEAD/DEAH box helicase family protein [Oceanispirochaeta sp.]